MPAHTHTSKGIVPNPNLVKTLIKVLDQLFIEFLKRPDKYSVKTRTHLSSESSHFPIVGELG